MIGYKKIIIPMDLTKYKIDLGEISNNDYVFEFIEFIEFTLKYIYGYNKKNF